MVIQQVCNLCTVEKEQRKDMSEADELGQCCWFKVISCYLSNQLSVLMYLFRIIVSCSVMWIVEKKLWKTYKKAVVAGQVLNVLFLSIKPIQIQVSILFSLTINNNPKQTGRVFNPRSFHGLWITVSVKTVHHIFVCNVWSPHWVFTPRAACSSSGF